MTSDWLLRVVRDRWLGPRHVVANVRRWPVWVAGPQQRAVVVRGAVRAGAPRLRVGRRLAARGHGRARALRQYLSSVLVDVIIYPFHHPYKPSHLLLLPHSFFDSPALSCQHLLLS